jgi:fatty acid-binding protein DegV
MLLYNIFTVSSSAKKIAICVDSSIAIEKNTYKDLYIIPLTINETVNGQTFSYRDGIDITCDKVAKKLLSGSFIKTASSIPGDITALFEKICDKYDEIYCFTAPKSISGTYKS